jgi:hypothetical protein
MGEWKYSLIILDFGTSVVSGQLHAPAALSPGERTPGTHWIGGIVGPRTRLVFVEKRLKYVLLLLLIPIIFV